VRAAWHVSMASCADDDPSREKARIRDDLARTGSSSRNVAIAASVGARLQ
jgi:hypothetical protein